MSNILKSIAGSPDKPLKIGEVEIDCYVLEDGRRVISQRGLHRAIGIQQGSGRGKYQEYGGAARLVSFLDKNNLIHLITNNEGMVHTDAITFNVGNKKYYGYDANLLQEIVRGISKAYLKGHLPKHQEDIGINAEALDDAFSKIGIVALIDEVTGYQELRTKDALEKIFNELLLDKAKLYAVTFPVELYKQWFRLNGWDWRPENAQKRPGVIGTWTNDLIYNRMAPGLLKELKRRNPKNEKGYRASKHFQFLTDEVGEPKLIEFFGGLIALAKATTTWRKYNELVERAYPKFGDQLNLDLNQDDEA